MLNRRQRLFAANNQGGNLRQALLDSAPFRSSLTYTAVPQSAASGTTGTFTRATTKTVENNDGYLVTLASGEIGFPGARRVRNVMRKSEDFSGAEFTKTNCTVAKNLEGPDGVANSACTVTATGASALLYDTQGITPASCTKAVTSVYLKRITGTGTVQISANGANTNVTVALTTSWQRFEASATTLVSGTFPAILIATSGDAIGVAFWQEEDVTAQTTQTAGEYVSVGVESAPYYHGSMVDGVKCFPTDLSGNPIAASINTGYVAEGARTNLCLQSNTLTTAPWADNGTTSATQNVVGPDGATSAWTLTDNDAGIIEWKAQDITLTAAAHTFSVFVKKTTGAQSSYPLIIVKTATHIALATIDTSNGVATAWSAFTGLTILSGVSANCVSFNSSFWRVSLTYTATAAAYTHALLPSATTNATQSTGTWDAAATGSAVFYGAQVELGSFASSYIATTTAAVTRDAEIDAYSTASNITAAAGYISLQFTPTHTPSGTIALWGTYVDASNYTAILHDATNLIFRKRIAGSNYDATIANAFVSGTTYKMAATWGAAGTSIALDGTLGTGHANTTAAQIAATMQFGADGNSLQQPFASVGAGYIGQRQLSASELQAITR